MTKNKLPNEGPVLDNQPAPEHGASFWSDLELGLQETAGGQTDSPTEQLPAASVTPIGGRTEELPVAAATSEARRSAGIDELGARRSGRRIWPLAAAAAVLAMVGVGFLATRNPTNPALTTDLVAGTPEAAEAVPLDGPTNGDGDPSDSEDGSDQDGAGAADPDALADTQGTDGATSSAAPDPTPGVAPRLAFELAPGSDGEPEFFPLDGGLPSGATFLANGTALTWWTVADGDCADSGTSDIRYVNGSGFTQDVGDPNPTFTGDVSHFTPGPAHAAWLVSCNSHLELWVASAFPSGPLDDAQLVWFGPGQVQNALMLWADDELNLSILGTDGSPFSIEFDTDDQTVTRNGRPTRFALESGVIEHRTFPVAASRDGDISYWPGVSDQGAGACSGSFGRADTLWLRRLNAEAIPVWEPALADETRIGAVTAMAIEPEFTQVAFADACPDESGRVFLATQRADGQLSNLREIDLSPYVPGFADELYWIDSQTLRIETDNSQYGIDTVRLDFRLDDGRDNGVIVQLD